MTSPRPTPLADDRKLQDPSDADRRSFGAAFERIVGVMARLRAPDGCPWDREQTLESLRTFLIEEAYELLDAIDDGSVDEHREELGDVLLQIVFQAEIRRQEGAFDAADVAHAVADKLVRRHPHVFGGAEVDGAEQAYAKWEDLKKVEKAGRSALAGVPRSLPALLRAQRVTDKAKRAGFDWEDASGPLEKLHEEVGELEEALASGDRAAIEHEIGDALFTLVNLCRFHEVSAEDALRATVDRFSKRFRHVEAAVEASGRVMREVSLQALEDLWTEAKRGEGQ